MKIDHIRFCVEDAKALSRWFTTQLGFHPVARGEWHECQVEIVCSHAIYFVLITPLTPASTAAQFLARHPAGVSDVVFAIDDLELAIARAVAQGATLLQPIQTESYPHGHLKWATLAAWGSLSHTLVQRSGITPLLPSAPALAPSRPTRSPGHFTGIDHIVLNVPKGDLAAATTWYDRVLNFQPQQKFAIQTQYSGLCSQVMRHPASQVQLPINEPTSPNSQIQEFLDINRGAGVQHIALETIDLIRTIAHLRTAGLPLIQVPSTYYAQLRDRPSLPFSAATLHALETEQILVDWQADPDAGVLLQTFTQPILGQPTFFLELIERQPHPAAQPPKRAQGFGEGNFQALFEAIEREQMKRGNLTPPTGENH